MDHRAYNDIDRLHLIQHFFLDYGLLFLNDNGLTKIRVCLPVTP